MIAAGIVGECSVAVAVRKTERWWPYDCGATLRLTACDHPGGHVLHVDTTSNTLVVENELGAGVPLIVDARSLFFFRTPSNAQSDATAIGQGTAFLSNLVRGFKVHASVVDPLASPWLPVRSISKSRVTMERSPAAI